MKSSDNGSEFSNPSQMSQAAPLISEFVTTSQPRQTIDSNMAGEVSETDDDSNLSSQATHSKSDVVTSSAYRLQQNDVRDSVTLGVFTAITQCPSSGALVQSAPRIPYENGYGDFCFGRAIEWKKSSLSSLTPEHLKSHNAIFKEPGAFSRIGPFQFCKLPHEIRKRIMRILIAPFFNDDTENPGTITVHLGEWSSPFSLEDDAAYSGDYVNYLNERRVNPPILYGIFGSKDDDETPLESVSSEERTLREEKFLKNKLIHWQEQAPHPQRTVCEGQELFEGAIFRADQTSSHHYTMSVWPWVKEYTGNAWGYTIDWPLVDFLRRASNVSTQFREELGLAFWQRTRIYGSENTKWLRSFLEARPAIHIGIKTLDVDYSTDLFLAFNYSYREDTDFAANIEYLTTVLDLDSICVHTSIVEADLEEFVHGRGQLMELSVFRQLKVRKKFDFTRVFLWIGDNNSENYNFDEDTADERGECVEKLWDTHHQNILDYIMPDTLRQQKPETDEEKYLASRSVKHDIREVEDN